MNIFSFYNQNRKLIWVTIIAIIVIIALIRGLNAVVVFSNERQEEERENRRLNAIEEEKAKVDELITEESIKKDKRLLIDVFIDYCNANEIEKAYSLLSDNCKNQMFKSIDIFKKDYYERIFKTKKLYKKELVRDYTYKVKFYEDALTSGKMSDISLQDYYTIDTQKNNSVKLNINSYIGESNINKTYNNEKIQITVVKKQIYDEYEEYELEVQNLTDKNIALDTMQYSGTMYIEGDSLKESYFKTYETSLHNLVISATTKRTIKIRYNKEYTINKRVNSIVFSDVLYEYDLKKPLNEQKNRSSIRISI